MYLLKRQKLDANDVIGLRQSHFNVYRIESFFLFFLSISRTNNVVCMKDKGCVLSERGLQALAIFQHLPT